MATENYPDDTSIDLPMQPTGSGVADLQTAEMQAAIADGSAEGSIADETAGFAHGKREGDGTPTKTQA